MSTRSGKRSGKSKGSDRSNNYDWSDWTWDESGYQWYRARLNSRGKYEYEYQLPATVEGNSTPRGETSTANFAILPNDSTSRTPEYYSSQEYGYHDSSQTSSAIDDLSGDLAQSSLDSGQVESTQATPYDEQKSREQLSGGASSDESVATPPIPIPPNSSRSVSDAGPCDGSPSSISTIVGRERGFNRGIPPAVPSGYVPSGSAAYYQPQQVPYGGSYDRSYGQHGPSMVDSYNAPHPSASYSESSRGYTDSQSEQTYEASAATSSGAITPKDSHMMIRGTPGKEEALDPKFRVHKSRYFAPGQVFKVLWFEPQGEPTTETSVTEVTDFSWVIGDKRYGQRAHSSIRRFVIVAADHGHCQCLPILTYHRQATTKRGVKRDDHAIIYTGDRPPEEIEGEERLRLRPIRVIPKTPRDKLEKESRINYAKIYTVEHNVKVLFIGQIAQDSQHALVADFDAVWMNKRQMNAEPPD